jgi:hypothetical protein
MTRWGDDEHKAKGREFLEFERMADAIGDGAKTQGQAGSAWEGDDAAADPWGAQRKAGFQNVSLNSIRKAQAAGAYELSSNLRNNIKTAFEKIAGRTFTEGQIRNILGDVANGPSTTWGGLMKFSDFNPSSGKFTPEQVGIVSTYVRELPGGPLNDSVKQGWQAYLNAGRASR